MVNCTMDGFDVLCMTVTTGIEDRGSRALPLQYRTREPGAPEQSHARQARERERRRAKTKRETKPERVTTCVNRRFPALYLAGLLTGSFAKESHTHIRYRHDFLKDVK